MSRSPLTKTSSSLGVLVKVWRVDLRSSSSNIVNQFHLLAVLPFATMVIKDTLITGNPLETEPCR